MRSLFVVIFVMIMMVSESGCAQKLSTDSSNVTIGFVGVGDTQGSAIQKSEKDVVQAISSAGMKIDYIPEQSLDPQSQVFHFDTLVNQHVSAIIVNVQFTNLWVDSLTKAHEEGIPVILFNAKPIGMPSYLYTTYVGPLYRSVGEQAADWAVSHGVQSTDDTLVVQRPYGSSTSTDLTNGWAQQIQTGAVVRQVIGTWDVGTSIPIVSKALSDTNKLPSVIFATDPSLAQATIQALNQKNIPITDTPQPGGVCVLALGSSEQSEDVDTQTHHQIPVWLTYSLDYSNLVVKTVQSVVQNNQSIKDVSVPVTIRTRS